MSQNPNGNPNEIFVAQNQTNTLGVSMILVLPDGAEIGKKYAKMSRVTFSLQENGGNSVKANIAFADWAGIVRDFEVCRQIDINRKISGVTSVNTNNNGNCGSLASSVMLNGRLKGKTPLQVLNEPNGRNTLLEQRDYYVQHLQSFPSNATFIDAIDDALNNPQNANVQSVPVASGIYTIYKALLHGNCNKPHQQMQNMFYTTDCIIEYLFGNNYPINITISNYYAPINRDATGRQQVVASQATPKDTKSMRLSVSDFAYLIEQVKASKHDFRIANLGEANAIKDRLRPQNNNQVMHSQPVQPMQSQTVQSNVQQNDIRYEGYITATGKEKREFGADSARPLRRIDVVDCSGQSYEFVAIAKEIQKISELSQFFKLGQGASLSVVAKVVNGNELRFLRVLDNQPTQPTQMSQPVPQYNNQQNYQNGGNGGYVQGGQYNGNNQYNQPCNQYSQPAQQEEYIGSVVDDYA